jgi:hypothetical protein
MAGCNLGTISLVLQSQHLAPTITRATYSSRPNGTTGYPAAMSRSAGNVGPTQKRPIAAFADDAIRIGGSAALAVFAIASLA